MKFIIRSSLVLVTYLFILNSLYSQPFPFLKKVESKYEAKCSVYINSKTSTIYNKKLNELEKSHALYHSIDCESTLTLLSITNITQSGKQYAIAYGYCPEPEFYIFSSNNIDELYATVEGSELFIPGNGFLYVSGHINSNFNVRRKFKFTGQGLIEIKQPFYKVGLKSKTLNPIQLYKSKETKEVIASLPANYKVEVLIAENYQKAETLYLISTEFGLVGWAKIRAGQYESKDIEGIFFNGD